jgi:hypothetical protein
MALSHFLSAKFKSSHTDPPFLKSIFAPQDGKLATLHTRGGRGRTIDPGGRPFIGKSLSASNLNSKETAYVISKIAKEFLRCQAYDRSEYRGSLARVSDRLETERAIQRLR